MSRRVRIARPEDAAALLAIYGPVVRETAISFEEEVPMREEMERRVRETLPRLPWLVASEERPESELVLGYACASPHRVRAAYRWSVEVGIYLAAEARGAGLGRALYEVLLEILTRQGYLNALGGVGLPNPASVRLHESLGFERIATYAAVGFKQGAWHDVGWWQRRLARLPERPPEPRPFAEVRAEI